MSTPAILVGLGMLLLTIPLVIGPLFSKKRERAVAGARQPGKEDYQDTLLALRDLEFDYQSGIVAVEDYARLRDQLIAQAARARAEDEATKARDARIEAAVQARRRPTQSRPGKAAEERLEAVVQKRRRTAKKACAACHTPLKAGDKFCPHCGAAALNSCSQCGRAYQPGDKFCAACGNSVS
jgi:RNA polymerase subunit RPABC4/transcription elongation factor Spt4